MIRIAICDDEELIASEIESLITDISKKYAIEVETDVFCNALNLEKEYLMGNRYDLLYLDIQMEKQNGIAAAKNIRIMDANVMIVYISSYTKFVEDVFEVDAFDFIRKPINIKRFEKCFLKAEESIVLHATNFECRYKKEWLKFSIGEIIYFESSGRKIRIHLVGDKIEEFNGKLDNVEIDLKNSKIPFLRIHKSYLVSFYFIRALSRTEIRFSDGKILPVSPERQNDIKERYGRLLGGEISDK